jgi:hypothetical protein
MLMLSALPYDGRLENSERPHAARGLLVGLAASLLLWGGIAWAVV